MSTQIVRVVIRDCDAKADTGITFTAGCVLDPKTLPKNWTLDFAFSGKFRQVSFVVDGKPVHIEEAAPYCPAGDNTPLNLDLGPHTISVSIDGAPAVEYPFTVGTPTPPPTNNSTGTATFFTNLRAVTDASGDPVDHPELLTACNTFGFFGVRQWLENHGTITKPWADNYFEIPLKWAAAGKKVIAQNQFDNKAVPSDSDWQAKWNNTPDSKATGIWAISLANEVGPAYLNATPQQVAHLMQLAYPILHGKGYQVIAPSYISNLNAVKELVSLGAYQFCDLADFHIYEHDAATSLANADAAIAVLKTTGKPWMFSEFGTRGSANGIAGWAQQNGSLTAGLKTRQGMFGYFPLIPIDGIAIGQPIPTGKDPLANYPAPLNVSYQANQPFYNSLLAAVK